MFTYRQGGDGIDGSQFVANVVEGYAGMESIRRDWILNHQRTQRCVVNAYDPLDAPNPGQWLALDEGERLRLVIEHHRQTGVELPSEEGHAAIHVVVENQAALGDEVPTQATLARLMREGLDRHDAVRCTCNWLRFVKKCI